MYGIKTINFNITLRFKSHTYLQFFNSCNILHLDGIIFAQLVFV
jgi:hypothetical protein